MSYEVIKISYRVGGVPGVVIDDGNNVWAMPFKDEKGNIRNWRKLKPRYKVRVKETKNGPKTYKYKFYMVQGKLHYAKKLVEKAYRCEMEIEIINR